MNKIIIRIIFLLLLSSAVFCWFNGITAEENEPVRAGRRLSVKSRLCGDGLCDAKEQANPNLCPKDCRQTQPQAAPPAASQSPELVSEKKSSLSFITGFKLDNFGNDREISRIHFELAKELKLDHMLVPVVLPRESDMQKIDWSAGLDYYYLFELSRQYGVKILPAFYKLGVIDGQNGSKYADFVISFLDEFYRDGNMTYIEFQNEPVKGYNGKVSVRFKGTPSDLAKGNIAAYDAIKTKYPFLQIGTAGFMSTAIDSPENKMMNEYYKEYFTAGPKFDFLALHCYPKTSSYLQTTNDPEKSEYNFLSEYEILATYRKILEDYGYGDKPIFVSEGKVDMPFKNPDGKITFQWLSNSEASILLTERIVWGLSNSEKSNIIGLMTSGTNAPVTGFFSQQSVRENRNDQPSSMRKRDRGTLPAKRQRAASSGQESNYSKTEQFEFYDRFLGLLRKYPYYSKHIAGEINSTNYWIEEFKDKEGRKMWLAFCPFLFLATGENSDGRLKSVAVEKSIIYPQDVILNVNNAEALKVSTASDTRTIKAVEGRIAFRIEKNPVFIEEE